MRLTVMLMGSVLRLKNGMLLVESEGDAIEAHPLRKIEELVVEANALVSSSLICKLAEMGANVVFCTPNGWPRARVENFVSGRLAAVRKRQMLLFSNTPTAVLFSASIASAKMAEQCRLIADLEGNAEWQREASRMIRDCMGRAAPFRSIEEIMGAEGRASRRYFEVLKGAIGEEWHFEGRRYNPPPDPVNAMLSYGYGVLYTKIFGSVARCGLDPYIGALHSDKYGRKSLVYDLAEPFKPGVVDRAVLTLIRHRQVEPQDFEKSKCLLNEKAKKQLVAQIEKRLEDLREWRGRRLSYLSHIEMQSARLKSYLNKERAEFIPFGA